VKCQKSYTKEKKIAALIAGKKNTQKVGRSSAHLFDLKKNCLFCGKDADEEPQKKETTKPTDKRDTVHQAETFEFKTKLLNNAERRNDKLGEEVSLRIRHISDLVAAEGRYHNKCYQLFFRRLPTHVSTGRPEDPLITAAIQHVYNYIEGNEVQCQFTLDEIFKDYNGYVPVFKTIRDKLMDMYGEDVFTTSEANRKPIICFRNTGYSILTEKKSQEENKEEERILVVKAAADIIREDIRTLIYNLDPYPPSDSFLDTVENYVPESLKLLLETITKREAQEF
jgi:hypothetical protein